MKSGKYKYLLVADRDKENELVKEIIDTYKVKTVEVNTLTLTLTDDYFNIMTEYIENIKTMHTAGFLILLSLILVFLFLCLVSILLYRQILCLML